MSHPDDLNVIPSLRVFNDPSLGTFSRYDSYTNNTGPRGLLSLNYAHTDGSVVRLNEVMINDSRMATVSYRVVPATSGYPSYRVQLPKE